MKFNEKVEEILNEGSIKSMDNISKYILDEYVDKFREGEKYSTGSIDSREKWGRHIIAYVNHRFSKYIEATNNIFGQTFALNNMQMLAYRLYIYINDNNISGTISPKDKKDMVKLITDWILSTKKTFYNDFT